MGLKARELTNTQAWVIAVTLEVAIVLAGAGAEALVSYYVAETTASINMISRELGSQQNCLVVCRAPPNALADPGEGCNGVNLLRVHGDI